MDSNQTWQKYYLCGKSSEYKKKIDLALPQFPGGEGTISPDSELKNMKALNLKIIEKLSNLMHICEFKISRTTKLIRGLIFLAPPQIPPGMDPRGPVRGTNRKNGPILMKFSMINFGGVTNKIQPLNFSPTPIYPPWGGISPPLGNFCFNGPIFMKFGMNDSGGARNKTQPLDFSCIPIYLPMGGGNSTPLLGSFCSSELILIKFRTNYS